MFFMFHICFFLSVLKKNKHCTYAWRHKDVKAQREVAYHDWKNLTHTTKTRQVKRTQMVATAGFTIRVFVTFSDC